MIIFNIADLTIGMDCFQNIKVSEEFLFFQIDGKCLGWNIKYILKDILTQPVGNIVSKSLDDLIIEDNHSYSRVFLDREDYFLPYAITNINYSTKEVIVEVLKQKEEFFTEAGNSLFHSCWERILIEERRLLLHASCVDTRFGGILFSGKSGIGKSTQSDLWVRYEGAEIINGDRPILSKDDSWKAWGSPYAGSSRIHKNKACDIRCIVILQQDSKCTLRKLRGLEAFQKVYAGTTIYRYDKEFVEKAVDMVNDLISEIPVYELSCTPDQNAVNILKGELEKLEDGR